MTQFTQTSTLETNRRKISRPRKGNFNYYAAKEGALKVKGYNFGEKDVVLDRKLEGFSTVNPFGITNETTVIEAFNILTAGLSDKMLSVTYAELVALRDASELIVGQNYLISDFAQSYNIFDGGTMDIIEEQIGEAEPIIVTASKVNELYKVAISTVYPQDIIHYSLDLVDNRDIGFGDGAGTPVANFKGQIYYRKDTIQNVETHYDFRNVKFRRWAVDAVAYDDGTAYVAKDVCKASDGKIYKCITATTGEGDPTVNTTDWVLWLDITADAFVSWTADKTKFNIRDITTDNLIINNVTAGVDYNDFYTFGDYYNWVKNVSIGMFDLEFTIGAYSYATQLNNIVFKTVDESYTCCANNIGSNCCNNTIGAIFSGNTIGNIFTFNTIGNNFTFNTIGDNFISNTIGNKFSNNTIENSFGNNTIGNDFNFNTIGNGFYSNTIGNEFYSNTIGNYFNYNTIGNYSYYNVIRNRFISNTIENNFSYNTIGYNFSSNAIENNFNINTIGNNFSNNTIGNNFNSNTIGDDFNNNAVGNKFGNNTIGNNSNNNTIGNGFKTNTIGNDFYYNVIGDNFYYNAIGHYFNSNTIGNNFHNNAIGNNFYYNTIGNYLYKTIFGGNCRHNTIANKINGTATNKIITFGNSITMCTIQDFAFGVLAADLDLTAATHIRGAYNTTIYQDKTDGVKLSYMDGGVMQIVDVTA